MDQQRVRQLSLLIRARDGASVASHVAEHLWKRSHQPDLIFDSLAGEQGALEERLKNATGVICVADNACATAFHPDAALLSRVSERVPVLLVVFPTDPTEALGLPEGIRVLIYNPTEDMTAFFQQFDDWLDTNLPEPVGRLRSNAINSAFLSAVTTPRIIFNHLRTCTSGFGGNIRRAGAWIDHIPTQIVEQHPHADTVPLDPMRVSVVDLRDLLSVRPRVALVGTANAGRDDLLDALITETAVEAAQDMNAHIPIRLSLCNWERGEALSEFVRFHAPLLGTTAARQWRVHLFLTDVPRSLAFDTPRLRELSKWLESDTRFERVILGLPPGVDHAARRIGFMTLHIPTLTTTALEAFLGWTLPEHQAEVLWNRLGSGMTGLPQTPYDAAALVETYRAGVPLEGWAGTPTATAAWLDTDWTRYTDATPLPTERDEVTVGLASLAYMMLRDDAGDYHPYNEAVYAAGGEYPIAVGLEIGWLREVGGRVHFTYESYTAHFAALGVWWAGLATVLIYPQFDLDGLRIPTRWDGVLNTLAHIFPQPGRVLEAISDVDPILAHSITADSVQLRSFRTAMRLRVLAAFADDTAHLMPIFDELPERDRAAAVLDGLRSENSDVRRAAMWLMSRRIQADVTYYDAAWFSSAQHKLDTGGQLPDEDVLVLAVGASQLSPMDARQCVRLLLLSGDRARLAVFEWLALRPGSPVSATGIEALAEVGTVEAVPALLRALEHADDAALPAVKAALRPFMSVTAGAIRRFVDDGPGAAALLPLLDTLAAAPEANKGTILQLSEHTNPDVTCRALALFIYLKPEAVMNKLDHARKDNRFSQAEGRLVRDVAEGVRRVFAGERRKTSGNKRTPARKARKPAAKSSTSEMLKTRLERLAQEKDKLAAAVRSDNANVRRRVVEALHNAPTDEALPYLTALVRDDDEGVFEAASAALAAQGGEEAATALVDALSDLDETRHHRLIPLIEMIGDPAIPSLRRAITDLDPNTRGTAALLLGRLRVHAAVDVLKPALLDQKFADYHTAYVCDLAADALENLGTAEASEYVRFWMGSLAATKPPLDEPEIETAETAVIEDMTAAATMPTVEAKTVVAPPAEDAGLVELLRAIPRLAWGERERAARRVMDLLRDNPPANALMHLSQYLNHTDWIVRWIATEAIGLLDDRRALQALATMLNDEEWTIRAAAARGLGNHSAPPDILRPALGDAHTEVREAAVFAIGSGRDGKSLAALKTALNDRELAVRLIAIESIVRDVSPRVVPLLIKAMEDPSTEVRFIAVTGLMESKDRRAIPFLELALQDMGHVGWDDRRIRDVAREALEILAASEKKRLKKGSKAARGGTIEAVE